MNFLLSHNWLKEFLPNLREAPDEVAAKLSVHSASVERVTVFRDLWENIVIGNVVESKKHPNADRLTLNVVEFGFRKKAQVVCGGSNVVEGMLVAYAMPGAKVRWHGEGELVTLTPTTIRGEKSEGMICAGEEIALGKMPQSSGGILDLSWMDAKPGTPLVEALDLDDAIYDIEITTNRPDMMCVEGIAREVSVIFGVRMEEPKLITPRTPTESLQLAVRNQGGVLCPRYQAIAFADVVIKPSPWWMQKRLLMGGIRPINNVVDVTNYVLLELGQPTHVFDYEKLANHEIVVRTAKKGESLIALDDQTYELQEDMLVIADGKRPVAIAGIMGGKESGISEETRSVVLEIANFNPVSVRRSSRRLNLLSESQLRFEKGLPAEATQRAALRAALLLEELAGARVASLVHDVGSREERVSTVVFSAQQIRDAIGSDIRDGEIKSILSGLGFTMEMLPDGSYQTRVPYWRALDVEGAHDLVEEVARIAGYESLTSRLLPGAPPPQTDQEQFMFEFRLKKLLEDIGYTEMIVPSFTTFASLEATGMGSAGAVRLKNPLNEERPFLRGDLAGGILEAIAQNEHEYSEGSCFEIGTVFARHEGDIPLHTPRLLLAKWGREEKGGQFFGVKGTIERIADQFGIPMSFKRVERQPFNPVRTVAVMVNGSVVGYLGEVKNRIVRAFGIDGHVALVEIDALPLVQARMPVSRYTPPSSFPPALRDISFVIPFDVEYEKLTQVMRKASPLLFSVELFDVYTGKGVPEGKKSMAFHLTFLDHKKTLTDQDVERVFSAISGQLTRTFEAEIRSQ